MVPWWSLLILAAICLLSYGIPMLVSEAGRAARNRYRKKAAEEWSKRFRDEVEQACQAVRRNGVRYEIRITSWGPDEWRWAIYDADAVLLYWTGEAKDTAMIGVQTPYADGVARTRAEAEVRALTWISLARESDDYPAEFPATLVVPE